MNPERDRKPSDQDLRGEYRYTGGGHSHTFAYLGKPVLDLAHREASNRALHRVFELGCGNGSFAAELAALGYEVTAVDISSSGIEQAREHHAGIRFEVASAYDDLSTTYGVFDLVLSLEVVEHLYSPRKWASAIHDLLSPRGIAIVSTPYHGYLKNLALSAAGRWDAHMDPLWDHGHIKLWSVRSLTSLLENAGLSVESVMRIGRIPILAKSMVMTARRR